MIATFAAAFITGVFASMGVGGGMILIVYMTVFQHMPQLNAQGINLVYFIPIAILSLIIHTKNKLVEWTKVRPAILCGVVTAIIGSYAAIYIGSDILKRIFGGFILIIGIKELFFAKKK